jgi:hypothetical protein
MVLSSLGKDFRLIQKHFNKKVKGGSGTDVVMSLLGVFLVGTMFTTVILQRDISREGIEKWSPFRYENPNSVWHGTYEMLDKSIMKGKQK